MATAAAAASVTATEKSHVEEASLQYVLREADGRSAGGDRAAHSPDGIPVVDLRRLSQSDGGRGGGKEEEEEMAKLRSALGSWGVFQATGHGIPASLLDKVRSIGRQFLHLPMEEKQRYAATGEGFAEGYGRDQVNPLAHPSDWTDRLLLQVEPDDQRKLQLWPDNPVSFRETLQEYAARTKNSVQLILRAMARSLDLEETHFISQMGEKVETYCRFSHYPSCPRSDLVLGLRPHSDNSMITIILQGGEGDAEGLELLKDDAWIKVPNNPDVLLVQMGDFMEAQHPRAPPPRLLASNPISSSPRVPAASYEGNRIRRPPVRKRVPFNRHQIGPGAHEQRPYFAVGDAQMAEERERWGDPALRAEPQEAWVPP